MQRFDTLLWDPSQPNANDREFASDKAGWLLSAATQGYPLDAREARYVMQQYGDSADWYRGWKHWDPWTSLADGESLEDYQPPRDQVVTGTDGTQQTLSRVRAVELPYVFEYCASPLRAKTGVEFIDCAIVADPTQW